MSIAVAVLTLIFVLIFCRCVRISSIPMQITTEVIETTVGSVTVKNFKYTDNMRYTALYLLFTYFWTSEFIVAVGQVRACVCLKKHYRYSFYPFYSWICFKSNRWKEVHPRHFGHVEV